MTKHYFSILELNTIKFILDNSANDQLSRQMDAFEKEQQQKFKQEIEEHKRQLESQQAQHRSILDQQRQAAKGTIHKLF